MKNIFKILIASLFILSLAGCSSETQVPELLEPVGVEMDTAVVEITELTVKSSYEGCVMPYVEEITYSADVVIYKSYVVLGDVVEAGDTLIEFDTDAIEEQIQSIEDQIDYNTTANAYTNSILEIEIEIAELEYQELVENKAIWENYYEAVAEREDKLAELQEEADATVDTDTSETEDTTTEVTSLDESTEDIEPIEENEETTTVEEITLPEIEVPTVSQVSDGEIVLAKAAVDTAELNLSQSKETQALTLSQQKASISSLEDTLINNVLVAPISGTIVYYENLMEGDTVFALDPLICIADDTNLYISCDFISDTNLIDNSVEVSALINGESYLVEYVYMSLADYMTLLLANKNVTTEFNFLEIDDEVSSGDFVSLELYNTKIENALVVPSNAIYGSKSSGYYVYVVVDNELIKTDITKGSENDTFVEILSGLQEGDVVYVQN